jgi:bisphosphoglycerate-dependent phosphoglycerate mutase
MGVEEIHAYRFSAPLILKLLRDGIESKASSKGKEVDEKDNHRIYFFTNKLKRALRVGRAERLLDIDAISRDFGWMHIHLPWEKMIGRMYGHSRGE